MRDTEKIIKQYIEESKTIDTVKNFYNVAVEEPHDKEMLFFLDNWELNLAKAIIYEFGDASALSVAKAILAVAKQPIEKDVPFSWHC